MGFGYNLLYYSLEYLLYLFSLQMCHQLGMSGIKYYFLHQMGPREGREALGIPYHREAGSLLGLTGDNSPKKRIIAHDEAKAYFLPYLAWVYFFQVNFFSYFGFIGYVLSLTASLLCTSAMYSSGVFFLFKIYSESGFGFNFYLQGWRQVGLDYHNWQIKQDPVTGKPLHPKDQFFGPARVHIDIPPLDLHHWPWEQHETQKQVEEKKQELQEQRDRKLQRKLEKQAARQTKLQARKEQKDKAEQGQKEGQQPVYEEAEVGMDFFGFEEGSFTNGGLTSSALDRANNSGLSDSDAGLSPFASPSQVEKNDERETN